MYFRNIPDIEYDVKPISYPFTESEFVVAKNFFRRFRVNEEAFSYAVFFNKYSIKEGERPDTIAKKAYGDQFLDWVIILTNNLINPLFDWPLSNYELEKTLNYKYDDPYGTIHHYETYEIKNDAGYVVLPAGKRVDETFYNAPQFASEPNPPSSLPTPTSTRRATATLAYQDLGVTQVDVTSSLYGYVAAPSVVFGPVPNSSGAQATANLSSERRLWGFNVYQAGNGYTYPPIVSLSGNFSGISATAVIDGSGSVTAINVDGIKYDTTDSNQIYEFGNGTTIAPNGTGVGSTGGFNIGSTHLRFGDASGTRYAILNPVDTREINTVRVYAIRGNGSNGGETPDIVGTEDLRLQYEITNVGDAPSGNNWTDLGIIIDAVPNGSGTGVLDNYDFTLPETLKDEHVYFRLYQSGNSGAQYDHYGILSVNFLDTEATYEGETTVTLSVNPLDPSPSINQAAASAITLQKVDSITVTNGGTGYNTNGVPTVSFTGGFWTYTDSEGGATTVPNETIATAYTGYNLVPTITDGGAGYDTATATITGGGGNGATATLNISGGSVSSITMTSIGTGYTSTPDIEISYQDLEDVTVNEGDVIVVDGVNYKWTSGEWKRQITTGFKYYNNGVVTVLQGSECCRPVTIADWFFEENEKKREIYILKAEYLQSFIKDFRNRNKYKKSGDYISNTLKKTSA